MVKVKMLRNQPGCPDGRTHRLYHTDVEYDIPSNLARLFVEMGAAEKVEEKMIRKSPKDTDMGAAPMDKEEVVEDTVTIDIKTVAGMDAKEKKEYKKLILHMNRAELEKMVEDNELPVPFKSSWRDETVAKRIIEVLDL